MHHLLTLDCTRGVNARTVTESAEVVYQPRGRALQTERMFALSQRFPKRAYSKSPPQKVLATRQVVPKVADQEIDDMVTLTIDESGLRAHHASRDCNECQGHRS